MEPKSDVPVAMAVPIQAQPMAVAVAQLEVLPNLTDKHVMQLGMVCKL